MNDPVLNRTVQVKQFASQLWEEVAAELKLFVDGRRTLDRMIAELQTMSAGAHAFLDTAGQESTLQKKCIAEVESRLRESHSMASNLLISAASGEAYAYPESDSGWTPVLPAPESPLPAPPTQADLRSIALPEPLLPGFWETLALMKPNPWVQPESCTTEDEHHEDRRPLAGTEIDRATREEA